MDKTKAEDTVRIVVFGDSIAAFRGELQVAAFQLEKHLRANGVNAQVFNCGVPGNNMRDGAARFEQDVLSLKPQLAMISFGTNDAAIDVWDGNTEPRVSLDDYKKNFRHFIRELKARGVVVLVYSSPPMVLTENLKAMYGKPPYTEKGFNFMLARYVAAARDVAAEEAAYFVDVNKQFMALTGGDEAKLAALMPDGMHPNQAGQDIIAKALTTWFDTNLKAFSGDATGVTMTKPESFGKYRHFVFDGVPVELALSFPWTSPLDALETRHKSHDPAVARIYSEWRRLSFRRDGNSVSATFHLPGKGCYSLQARCLVDNKIVGVGKQDYIWALPA